MPPNHWPKDQEFCDHKRKGCHKQEDNRHSVAELFPLSPSVYSNKEYRAKETTWTVSANKKKTFQWTETTLTNGQAQLGYGSGTENVPDMHKVLDSTPSKTAHKTT